MIENTRIESYTDFPLVLNDEDGKRVNPWLIQRGIYRPNRRPGHGIDANVELDYMGAMEFELGALGRRILELSEKCEEHTVQLFVDMEGTVEKIVVRAFFNPDYYDALGVFSVITGLWEGELRSKERTEFNKFSWRRKDERKRKFDLDPHDVWFEISGGMIWTTNAKLANRMKKLIKASAQVMLDKRQDNAVRVEQIGEVRARLIAEGKIRPSKS